MNKEKNHTLFNIIHFVTLFLLISLIFIILNYLPKFLSLIQPEQTE
jgi:hypothetical protein